MVFPSVAIAIVVNDCGTAYRKVNQWVVDRGNGCSRCCGRCSISGNNTGLVIFPSIAIAIVVDGCRATYREVERVVDRSCGCTIYSRCRRRVSGEYTGLIIFPSISVPVVINNSTTTFREVYNCGIRRSCNRCRCRWYRIRHRYYHRRWWRCRLCYRSRLWCWLWGWRWKKYIEVPGRTCLLTARSGVVIVTSRNARTYCLIGSIVGWSMTTLDSVVIDSILETTSAELISNGCAHLTNSPAASEGVNRHCVQSMIEVCIAVALTPY